MRRAEIETRLSVAAALCDLAARALGERAPSGNDRRRVARRAHAALEALALARSALGLPAALTLSPAALARVNEVTARRRDPHGLLSLAFVAAAKALLAARYSPSHARTAGARAALVRAARRWRERVAALSDEVRPPPAAHPRQGGLALASFYRTAPS